MVVGLSLAAAAGASGALVGFAGALAIGGLASVTGVGDDRVFTAIAVLVLAGGVADLSKLAVGAPTPLARRSQVPMEWGRIFSPPVVAGLYGLRLGVGPLTMLSTWLWWSAWVGASLIGPGAGAITGATFGVVRVAVMAGATPSIVSRSGAASPLARIRAVTRPSWLAVDVSALVGAAVLVLVVAGCSRSGQVTLEPVGDRQGDELVDADSDNGSADDGAAVRGDTTEDGGGAGESGEGDEAMIDGDDGESTTGGAADGGEGAGETVVTTPAAVEPGDVDEPTEEALTPGVASAPEALAATVIDEVQWFERLEGPGADEFLDLEAAANRQPDPTEERPLLETRRFQGGWTRAFRNDTQDVVIAQVYEFETAAAADFYLEDGLITLGGYGVDFFDLADMDGVRGFKQDSVDEIGPIVSYGLTFTSGRRWYLLTLTGDPATATLDILVGATRDQLALAN